MNVACQGTEPEPNRRLQHLAGCKAVSKPLQTPNVKGEQAGHTRRRNQPRRVENSDMTSLYESCVEFSSTSSIAPPPSCLPPTLQTGMVSPIMLPPGLRKNMAQPPQSSGMLVPSVQPQLLLDTQSAIAARSRELRIRSSST